MDYANDPSIQNLLKKYAEIYAEKERQRELLERIRFPLEKRLKENIVGQVCGENYIIDKHLHCIEIIWKFRYELIRFDTIRNSALC